jgi:hypothetical protein
MRGRANFFCVLKIKPKHSFLSSFHQFPNFFGNGRNKNTQTNENKASGINLQQNMM